MATISNTPRPGYVFDVTDNVWYPIGVGGHSHGEIPATIADAKGDLIVGTAADTVARLAVGTNGQVLTADSSEATGLKYATPSSPVVPILTKAVMGADFTTSSTSYVDVTGMTITRTPTSATNNIQVTAQMVLFMGGADRSVRFRCVVGASNSNVVAELYQYLGGSAQNETIVFNFTNLAATSTVFKIQMLTDGSITVQGNNSGYLNSFSVLEVY